MWWPIDVVYVEDAEVEGVLAWAGAQSAEDVGSCSTWSSGLRAASPPWSQGSPAPIRRRALDVSDLGSAG